MEMQTVYPLSTYIIYTKVSGCVCVCVCVSYFEKGCTNYPFFNFIINLNIKILKEQRWTHT